MDFPGCSAPLHFVECRVPHRRQLVVLVLRMTMLHHLSLSFKNYICPRCQDFFMAPSYTCRFIILFLWNWWRVDLQSFASFRYTANWFNYICIYIYVLLLVFSYVRLLANLWTVACQAPLSMQFPKQEYWNGLIEGMFLTEGSNPCLLLDRQILYLWNPWEPMYIFPSCFPL